MGGEGKDRFEHFTISTMKTGNVVHCHKGAHTAMRLSLSQSSTREFFLYFVQSTHVTSSCIAFDQVILYLIVDCVVQMWKHGLFKKSEPILSQVRICGVLYFSVSQNVEKTENVRSGGNLPPFRCTLSWNQSVPARFSAILAGEKTIGTGNYQLWVLTVISHNLNLNCYVEFRNIFSLIWEPNNAKARNSVLVSLAA